MADGGVPEHGSVKERLRKRIDVVKTRVDDVTGAGARLRRARLGLLALYGVSILALTGSAVRLALDAAEKPGLEGAVAVTTICAAVVAALTAARIASDAERHKEVTESLQRARDLADDSEHELAQDAEAEPVRAAILKRAAEITGSANAADLASVAKLLPSLSRRTPRAIEVVVRQLASDATRVVAEGDAVRAWTALPMAIIAAGLCGYLCWADPTESWALGTLTTLTMAMLVCSYLVSDAATPTSARPRPTSQR